MARAQSNRPLSPHVGIYRWQISNTLSILHRATGFALSLGLIPFAGWLWSAAYSPECFAQIQTFAGSILGKLMLLGWTVCFFYHLANGIRHLNWDTGRGLAIPDMRASGWVVLAFTASLTVVSWSIILRKVGL